MPSSLVSRIRTGPDYQVFVNVLRRSAERAGGDRVESQRALRDRFGSDLRQAVQHPPGGAGLGPMEVENGAVELAGGLEAGEDA